MSPNDARRKNKAGRAATLKLQRPPGVPRSATFVETRRDELNITGEFRYRGRTTKATWTDGALSWHCSYDSKGRPHGHWVERDEQGRVLYRVPRVKGQMHGIARQFDRRGREVLRNRYVRGTGVDLWVDCGCVNELHEMKRSVPHGIERWGHPMLPYEELHWVRGKRTGVLRRWKGAALEEGFPKYLVDNEEVSRAKYLRVRRSRPELPPDRREDDDRHRPLHPSLAKAWIRRDIRAALMRVPEADE